MCDNRQCNEWNIGIQSPKNMHVDFILMFLLNLSILFVKWIHDTYHVFIHQNT